ncbi:glycosyltransferase [filamentous cyanobacterium LEGE 11480]|uniref:Glycosyltransferase n=2 Tax=Romeriopsis TaxID=2992131 RepID=A0A928Z411_9CYAN|nr:glycosyltransferase [Romeriopsis navalis LEGE 11480]
MPRTVGDHQASSTPAKSPKISIVMTIYNREDYLPQAIESILSQSYTDFELILWDDGSTDQSLEIANYYAAQDHRIQIITAAHQGRGPAIADACRFAQGEYIGLVDSDDLLAQTALAETSQYLDTHSAVGLVYTDYQIINADGSIQGYGHHCQRPYSPQQLLVEFMVFHFRLMRASVYRQIGGFNPEFVYAQDYDICLRFSEVTIIEPLKRPLYYYRHHKNNISCEKRIDQILFSKRAIEAALDRRGMAQEFELEFQISAQCNLVSKSPR